MKILKGTAKGKNLIVPKDVRPVSVLVRRAAFDILAEVVPEAKILDLFAGSGAMGIEALSNGAERGVFVDIKNSHISIVKKNLQNCKMLPVGDTVVKDATKAVRDFASRGDKFDIVFLDPPYHKGMLTNILQEMEVYDIVADSGFVVCFCYTKDEFLEKSSVFEQILKKKYGQTLLIIYRKQ